jgi:hypothetical protein
VLTATNNRYSYLRVTAIQIDVHPARETRPTRHTHPALSPHTVPDHTYLTRSMHSNLLHSTHEVKTSPLHSEEILVTKNRLAQPSSWVISFFLLHDNFGVGERGFSQVVTQLHRLTRPIYHHAIGMFNTCSRGPTHWSLTDTGGGYIHLRALPSLRLSKQTFPTGLKEDQTLNLVSGSLHSTSTTIYHLSIALLVSCVTCSCFSVPPIHLDTIISFFGLATCKDSNILNTYHSRPSIKNALQGPP